MQILINPNIDLRRFILHEQEYNDVQQCLSTGWGNKKYKVFSRFYRFFAVAQNSQAKGLRTKVFGPKALGGCINVAVKFA
jgi:hypothetical protein